MLKVYEASWNIYWFTLKSLSLLFIFHSLKNVSKWFAYMKNWLTHTMSIYEHVYATKQFSVVRFMACLRKSTLPSSNLGFSTTTKKKKRIRKSIRIFGHKLNQTRKDNSITDLRLKLRDVWKIYIEQMWRIQK